jgi:predicted aspartyl protease
VDFPPSLGLAHRGPCIQVAVGLAKVVATPLLEQGVEIPKPVSGLAMIDTGASHSCVDNGVATSLGLPVVDVCRMTSASHEATQANIYPIHVELLGTDISVDIAKAIGAALEPQGLTMLIGRDFLQHCTLFYNGLAGQVTLSAG